jgi:hypothetical protein
MAVIPPKADPRWKRLLTASSCPDFSCLATKLTVGRLRRRVKDQPTALDGAIDELCSFFAGNKFAENDLTLVCQDEGVAA